MTINIEFVGFLKTWAWLLLCIISATRSEAQVVHSFTEPYEQREVAASEPGAVSKTFVKEGQRVKAGDILAELANGDLRQKLRLAKLRASSEHKVNSAKAMVQVRLRQRDTLVPMLDSGHANQAEVEKAILDYAIVYSELQSAKLALEEHRIEYALIQAEIDRRTIKSPINGFVTEIHRRSGEYIAAAEPKFATIAQLDRLKVRFYLLAETAQELRAGQQVSLLLETGDRANKQDIAGQVDFVSPITNPDSGTTRVDVVIENEDLKIRSGTPCLWNGRI